MPVIRVSDATYERLKKHARPFDDTPEDIIRIALDALDAKSGAERIARPSSSNQKVDARLQPHRAKDGRLPQKAFRAPLVHMLCERNGRATTREIREMLEARLAPRLNEADYQPVTNGDPRWWNAVCWERNDLVKEGLLRPDSERGVWELSELGRKQFADRTSDRAESTGKVTWRDDVEAALDGLDRGHGATLHAIYKAVVAVRGTAARTLPKSVEEVVRRTLEENSSDSDVYKGGHDLFYMVEGKGSGVWGLRRKRQ